MHSVRGIRGAIRVENNSKEEIFTATRELLVAIIRANDVQAEDIASVFFTVTADLTAEFPAYATRDLGWEMVPLLCAREIDVPGSMTGVIRILMHVNTTLPQKQINHQYLGDTARLRPDLPGGTS
jgi:chorismate mutase